MYCPGCGTQNAEGVRFGIQCGTMLPLGGMGGVVSPVSAPHVPAPPKNPGVAAVLSFFFAGLGQIYNGQIGKGLGIMFAYFISILLMFVIIGFITTPILWIWGMIDAYQTAERINQARRF